jgi:hypothetical protein
MDLHMSNKEVQDAIKDILEYCRHARHDMTVGRSLGPLMLKDAAPASEAAWNVKHDWLLAEQMKQIVHDQLTYYRQLAGLTIPVSSDPTEHGAVLKQDIDASQERDELKFWSLLWAYYICGISHKDLGLLCGWERRNNEVLVKQGRDSYMLRKIVELEPINEPQSTGQAAQNQAPASSSEASPQVSAIPDQNHAETSTTQDAASITIDAREQTSYNNNGIVFNDQVTHSVVKQNKRG